MAGITETEWLHRCAKKYTEAGIDTKTAEQWAIACLDLVDGDLLKIPEDVAAEDLSEAW